MNPFRLALLLLSLGSLAAGTALLSRMASNYAQGFSMNSPEEIFAFTFASSASGPLLSAGIIGLVLWIAVGVILPTRSAGD